jgi:mono/diheme cytochrome c family protein
MRLLMLFLAGCEGILPEPDLERMKDQPNLRPYQRSEFFADERAMRAPPAYTVPARKDDPAPSLDRALIERGRARFDIYCAACHGRRGDGQSEVSRNMELRKPPSLIIDPVRGFPDERILRVIREGYGLMPSYAAELSPEERFAVVSYLRALQLSQSIEIEKLPVEMREALP